MSKANYIPQIRTADFVNDQLICLCDNYNCVLSINLETFNVEYAGRLKDECTFQIALSCDSLIYGDHILYSPYYSRNIHLFDVNTKEDYIISHSSEVNIINDKYGAILQDGSICYAIPFIGKKILEINMDKKEVIRTINICEQSKLKDIFFNGGTFSVSSGYKYKDKFYISVEDKPFIIELDFKNDRYKSARLEGINKGSCGIAGIDNLLYIYNKEHCIITYNIDEGKIVNKKEMTKMDNFLGDKTLIYDNNIYFLGRQEVSAIKYNIETFDIEYVYFGNQLTGTQREEYKFVGFIGRDGIILISDKLDMVIIRLGSSEYRHIKLEYDINKLGRDIMQNIYFYDMNIEYSELMLPHYIQYDRNRSENKIESNIGVKIYSTT